MNLFTRAALIAFIVFCLNLVVCAVLRHYLPELTSIADSNLGRASSVPDYIAMFLAVHGACYCYLTHKHYCQHPLDAVADYFQELGAAIALLPRLAYYTKLNKEHKRLGDFQE